ncbi:glucosamine-6-phosphate deaminase [Proteiniborus ethanoligenes]|uniref:Glucosamine-6-phosphate deaminase n=1 Tax=Proteiniborus ethanoligenes TaxID=415015 RepID=A0A1H3M047_9FIRM|nr:glucosamine-6-phosphate deaminase [Proteiniborus ethanoligenes]SDY69953.1 glucosamine-6-phosphate deaminase [Proteiniborus ethanoligenes]
MRILVVNDYNEMKNKAANIIASQMVLKPNSVLGLATGSTPLGTYEELVRLYKIGIISFSEITSFNLDEYYGLSKNNNQSYNYYMYMNLFNHVDIDEDNVHIPDGMCENIERECADYERKIKESGGIDLQLLGIGRNGHIGFNEPSDSFQLNTHLVQLDEDTIEANSRFFASIDEVPTRAISMGIGSILRAKKIVLLASGEEKADAIYDTVKGPITPKVPASILQLHPDVVIIADKEAASRL